MTPSSRPPSLATRGWRLQTKLIVSMLLVGVVPLLVGLGMAFWQGSKEIHEVSGESFKALATEAAEKTRPPRWGGNCTDLQNRRGPYDCA